MPQTNSPLLSPHVNVSAMPCESANMRSSSPTGPTTCNPTGIQFGPSNAGIVTQGTCSSVQMRLNAEFDTETTSAIASPDVLGVMIASQSLNTSAIARWH